MQRRYCWKDFSHPTYVLALSWTNRSAELSPPPTGRAYIRRRWTLGAQSTLGGCRGRWGGGGGESPFEEADKIQGETEGQKKVVKKSHSLATHSKNFPSLGPTGHLKEKAKKESRRKMLTWDEPGNFAMIEYYQIQLKAGTMQCWTETREGNIKNDKKRAKSRKTKPKKTLKSIYIEEELGPVQSEIRRIERREEKISLRWVCL